MIHVRVEVVKNIKNAAEEIRKQALKHDFLIKNQRCWTTPFFLQKIREN